MPKYKGNNGNLLQHWVLSELLAAARNHEDPLIFLDAHTMAPTACDRTDKSTNKFDSVAGHLTGQRSEYELAWQKLSMGPGIYPNSANFVVRILPPPRTVSMLLCEQDARTADLLRKWADEHKNIDIEIAAGDWRKRFRGGLPKREGLKLVSFDPYMFNRHNRKCREGNMYPDDLDLLVEATRNYRENTLIQLSTYSANDNNTQETVIEAIRSKLEPAGFGEAAAVKLDGSMMSLVFQRGVAFADELDRLPNRFREWFGAIP